MQMYQMFRTLVKVKKGYLEAFLDKILEKKLSITILHEAKVRGKEGCEYFAVLLESGMENSEDISCIVSHSKESGVIL